MTLGPDLSPEAYARQYFDSDSVPVSGSAAMSRNLAWLLLGAGVFAIAYLAQRVIAPFTGLSLTLFTGVLGAALAGFAIGCALGPRRSTVAGRQVAVRAIVGAVGVTLFEWGLHRSLFRLLNHADERLAVVLAATALVGLPCILLGFAFGAGQEERPGIDVLRAAAWLIGGAAAADTVFGV